MIGRRDRTRAARWATDVRRASSRGDRGAAGDRTVQVRARTRPCRSPTRWSTCSSRTPRASPRGENGGRLCQMTPGRRVTHDDAALGSDGHDAQVGLSMTTGKIVDIHVAEGDTLAKGDDVLDIDPDKIAGPRVVGGGAIRRLVAGVGDELPVGAVLAVVAPARGARRRDRGGGRRWPGPRPSPASWTCRTSRSRSSSRSTAGRSGASRWPRRNVGCSGRARARFRRRQELVAVRAAAARRGTPSSRSRRRVGGRPGHGTVVQGRGRGSLAASGRRPRRVPQRAWCSPRATSSARSPSCVRSPGDARPRAGQEGRRYAVRHRPGYALDDLRRVPARLRRGRDPGGRTNRWSGERSRTPPGHPAAGGRLCALRRGSRGPDEALIRPARHRCSTATGRRRRTPCAARATSTRPATGCGVGATRSATAEGRANGVVRAHAALSRDDVVRRSATTCRDELRVRRVSGCRRAGRRPGEASCEVGLDDASG